MRGEELDRVLPVLRGVADVVARRADQRGETLLERGRRLQRLVDRQRRLGQPGHLPPVPYVYVLQVPAAVHVHHLDPVRRVTGRADHFLVAGVPDQQDVVAVLGELHRFLVHLGHQRAGGVDRAEVADGRLGADGGGDAVRGEHHGRAARDVAEILDENRALALQRAHHVGVVHDLVPDVDRAAVPGQRLFHGSDGPLDPRAETAGGREQDPPGLCHDGIRHGRPR